MFTHNTTLSNGVCGIVLLVRTTADSGGAGALRRLRGRILKDAARRNGRAVFKDAELFRRCKRASLENLLLKLNCGSCDLKPECGI